ncbi:MAG TPA: signal peptidase II [Polyangiaceae bacterium]|jgi:signal peptidase II
MRNWRSFLLVAVSAGLFGCDHATKVAAEHELGAGRVVTVVPRVLELRYARNEDVAFNAFSGWEIPHKEAILLAISFAVLAATIVAWIAHRRRTPAWDLGDAGFAFVLAGALGNVADRLARGYVIDFIHVTHWPIFNVADACIVLGLVALGLSRSKARAAPA